MNWKHALSYSKSRRFKAYGNHKITKSTATSGEVTVDLFHGFHIEILWVC